MVYNNLGTSGGATKLFLRVSPNGLLIHTAGEGVNSTIIQCVHEQSLTGICKVASANGILIFNNCKTSCNGSKLF